MLREKWLIVVLACSALLAFGYAFATPVGAAPDESAHLRYIEVLATEGRLPVMDLAQRRANPSADRDFEAHQPPLYYVANVPAYWLGRALGGDAGIGWACRLLSILIGLAGLRLIRMLARELAPGQEVLQQAATVFAAFLPMRLAMMGSVNNDGLTEVFATLALLVMARMVGRSTVPAFRCSGVQAFRGCAMLGLVVALGLLTKATAILLLPPALMTLYLASGARDEGRETGAWQKGFVLGGAVLGGVVVVAAGWWFVRNHLLYGDPLAKRLFDEYFADTPRWTSSPIHTGFQDELGISFLEYMGRMVLPTIFASFWGAFGHLNKPELFMGGYNPNYLTEPGATLIKPLEALWPILQIDGRFFIPFKSWVYPLLVLAVLVSVAGWVVATLRRKRENGKRQPSIVNQVHQRPTLSAQPPTPLPGQPPTPNLQPARARWVAGTHALFVFAALLNFNATYFQGQGRYLLPAIGTIALALGGGWLAWNPKRERFISAVIGGTMLALAVYALVAVLGTGFRST